MLKIKRLSLYGKLLIFIFSFICDIAFSAPMQPQYEENLYSLKDLTGVYVVLDYVIKSSEKSHLSIKPDLEQEIQKRLQSAGLQLLSKEEMLRTLGNPQLDIYPNYPADLATAVTDSDVEVAIPNLTPTRSCCYTSVWGAFSQGASILRKPADKYRLGTWGSGSNTDSCDNLGGWMSDASLKVIDNFIADFKKAKTLKPKASAAGENTSRADVRSANNKASRPDYVRVKEVDDTKGMACDTAFIVYAQIFKSGTSTIGNSKKSLLDKLAAHMVSCNNFRYRIETHADNKGSKQSRELLLAQRAIALHNYLMDKGVDEDRFEMRFFESRKQKPNSEEDLTITPLSN